MRKTLIITIAILVAGAGVGGWALARATDSDETRRASAAAAQPPAAATTSTAETVTPTTAIRYDRPTPTTAAELMDAPVDARPTATTSAATTTRPTTTTAIGVCPSPNTAIAAHAAKYDLDHTYTQLTQSVFKAWSANDGVTDRIRTYIEWFSEESGRGNILPWMQLVYAYYPDYPNTMGLHPDFVAAADKCAWFTQLGHAYCRARYAQHLRGWFDGDASPEGEVLRKWLASYPSRCSGAVDVGLLTFNECYHAPDGRVYMSDCTRNYLSKFHS